MSLNSWLDARIAAAVDEAMADAKADIIAEIQATETTLTTQITSLPGQIIQGILAGLPNLLNPFKAQP
jgi:hypothetical protein